MTMNAAALAAVTIDHLQQFPADFVSDSFTKASPGGSDWILFSVIHVASYSTLIDRKQNEKQV